MDKLDLDIIRLQGEAHQLLKDVLAAPGEIDGFTETMANLLTLGLNIVTKEWELTEDQAMALLILTIIKATEVGESG